MVSPDIYQWYENATAEQLCAEALCAEGALCEVTGEAPPNMPADKLSWQFVSDYPLSNIKYGGAGPTSGEDWIDWFKGELEQSKENPCTSGRWDELVGAKVIRDAVILVEDSAGEAHLWDGCHRTGAAHLNGMSTLPAIVGRLQT